MKKASIHSPEVQVHSSMHMHLQAEKNSMQLEAGVRHRAITVNFIHAGSQEYRGPGLTK
jgi:hypothetical protein